jgi:hypothetical protein
MTSTVGNYSAVRAAIGGILTSDKSWDDGSLGPVLVRLAWHASGTYDLKTRSGGSNGATMRFAPESSDGANAGLQHARLGLRVSVLNKDTHAMRVEPSLSPLKRSSRGFRMLISGPSLDVCQLKPWAALRFLGNPVALTRSPRL